jgi:hypothetical protein
MVCNSALVQAVIERDVRQRALELGEALLARDLAALERLCDPEAWNRACSDELSRLSEHAAAAALLGTLDRRSLLRVATPGAAYPEYVVEQQWIAGSDGPVVEDERLFALADRTEVEASGDAERIARLRTKLAAQDAASAYAAALVHHDGAAVAAMWSPRFAGSHADRIRERIGELRSAELIGSVGPRTLVRCVFADAEETVELLWREQGARWLIEAARTFTGAG